MTTGMEDGFSLQRLVQQRDTYNSGTDTAYCGGACPNNDSSDTGKYVATYIAQAASTSGINPKLLLVKLQVESSLVSSVSIPSDSLLNFALGCGTTSTFGDQLDVRRQILLERYD